MASKSKRGRKAPPQAGRKPVAPVGTAAARLRRDLAQARAQQAATAAVLKIVRRSPGDAQPVFEAIVNAAQRLLGAHSVNMLRLERAMLHIAALTSTSKAGDRFARSLYPMPVAKNRSHGTAIRTRRPHVTPDTEKLPAKWQRAKQQARARGYRSVVSVPMLSHGKPIGSIAVTRVQPGVFSRHEIRILETFADQAVIAIENARRFQETREALERQTATAEILRVISSSPTDVQPVLDAVAESACRLCGAVDAVVMRVEGGNMRRVAHSGSIPVVNSARPVTRHTPTGRAMLERRSVHVADIVEEIARGEYAEAKPLQKATGFRTILCAPLVRDDAAIGAIVIRRPEVQPFADKEVELLKTFADQAVIAIENVRLFNETKESLERQTATAEILTVISGSPTDVQPVFDSIAASAARLFAPATATIIIRSDDKTHLVGSAGPLVSKSARDELAKIYPRRFDPELSVTALCIHEMREIRIADTESPGINPKMDAAITATGHAGGHRSAVLFPLVNAGVGIGLLGLTHPKPGFALDDKQRALMKAFADQAVIAIENVRLFNETREALERQTATAEVLQVISSSVADAKPVFDKILASCRSLFAGSVSTLGLLGDDDIVHIHLESIFANPGAEAVRAAHPRPARDSIYGYVAHKRRVFYFPDVQNGPDVPEGLRRSAALIGANYSAVYAPLMWEGRGIGTLSVAHVPPAPFSEKEIKLLKTFADQAAIAIQNARLFNETKEALERQTATAEILNVIAGSPSDVQPVFDAIAKSAYRLIGGFSTAVARVFDNVLHLVAFSSTDEAGNEALKHAFPMPVSRSKAARTGEPVAIGDTEALPDSAAAMRELARTRGFRSILIVPMLREGVATGTISVTRKEPGEFSSHQVDLLKTFADQAVIAIENVRLFNETREALERQTATGEILKVIASSPADVQPVFDAILAVLMRLFTGFDATVWKVDGDQLVAVSRGGATRSRNVALAVPITRDLAHGIAILERKVVRLDDVASARDIPGTARRGLLERGRAAVLMVPLIREGKAVGAISVSLSKPTRFSDKQVALIETFADQAVIAIENVRLFNETKEALERQTATSNVLREISRSTFDLEAILQTLLENAMRLCGAVNCAMFLKSADSSFRFASQVGYVPDSPLERVLRNNPILPGADTTTGRALLERRTVHTHDIHSEPGYRPDLVALANYRTNLAVPMLRDGEVMGAITLTRGNEVSPFTDKQIELVEGFSAQAVIAIENVRLFNETREALERQTATAEILRVISSSPSDLKPVFDAILEKALRLCDAHLGLLGLYDGEKYEQVAYRGEIMERLEWSFGGPFVPDPRSMVGRMLAEKKPLHEADMKESLSYREGVERAVKFVEVTGARSFLIVPMLKDGKIIGGIGIYRAQVRPFTQKQIDLVSTFASQAVIAIENVRLFNETREALERQTATAEVLQVISSSVADTAPVFRKIIESCENLFGIEYANIALIGEDGLMHLMQDSSRLGDEGLRAAMTRVQREFPRPVRDSIHGYAIYKGRVLHFPDVANGPDVPDGLRESAKWNGNYSALYAPMFWEGKGIGALAIHHAPPAPFSDNDNALLKTFADQAVIAIQNARLFNETREALERQTATSEILKVIASSPSDVQPVFEVIAQSAHRLFDRRQVGFQIVRDGALHVAAAAGFSEEQGAAVDRLYPMPIEQTRGVQALLGGRVLETTDVEKPGTPAVVVAVARAGKFRSLVSVPLLRESELLGVLSLTASDVRPRLDEKQIALLKTFADQAVIAIENVRLFNETKEALERQTATAEILKVISSSPTDTQPVFEAIARSVVRLCDGLYTYLGLFDGKMIDFVAFHNVSPQALAIIKERFPSAPIPGSSTGRAILDRTAIHIPDVMADAEYSFKDLARADGYRAILAVPMLREGSPIGVIAVGRRSPFSGDQIELVKTFADQAVIAIENVRLFKELQSRTEALTQSVGQLTALGEVGRAVSSTLDLEQVLQTIVQRAVQLTGLDVGSIYEYDERAEEFHLKAAENMAPEFLEVVRRTPIRKGDGTVGGTAVTLQPAQVPDIRDESYRSSRKELLIEAGNRAVLTVPLLHEDHILGALSVTRRTPGPFAPEVVELMKTFATQSAMAIQNARLYREIAEKGKQLEVASQHKSQFLASMSHELRTPLNAILGFNEMLLGQVYGEVPPDMQEPLADIQTSGKHLLRLINNVLDLAKIEAGRMELALTDYSVHDMVESVRSTLRPLAAEKGLEFLATLPADLPLACGDAGRITQCLMNLAGNSLKFTKAGKVEISVAHDGDLLRYCVLDTGIGIPPEKIETLFTEFKQTDAAIASEYGGTGLGLSITKKFIEMHGGRIWIESEPGKGSAFIFEVPLRVAT